MYDYTTRRNLLLSSQGTPTWKASAAMRRLWYHLVGLETSPRQETSSQTTQETTPHIPSGFQCTAAGLSLSGVDYETMKARHRQTLESISHVPWPTIRLRGRLILLLDGLWFTIAGERWIVYLMALRSIQGNTATFLRPIVRREHESRQGWERALETIPANLQRRVCALVSDGLRGLRLVAKERGWQYQWCHFHLLGRIANVFGTRKRTVVWLNGRRRSEACIRELITTSSPQRIHILRRTLIHLCEDAGCPRKIRMMIREVLRHTDVLRTYLDYPALRLPATSNVMESLNSRLRSLSGRSRGFRTGQALERWMVVYVYFNSTSKCDPKIPQN